MRLAIQDDVVLRQVVLGPATEEQLRHLTIAQGFIAPEKTTPDSSVQAVVGDIYAAGIQKEATVLNLQSYGIAGADGRAQGG